MVFLVVARVFAMCLVNCFVCFCYGVARVLLWVVNRVFWVVIRVPIVIAWLLLGCCYAVSGVFRVVAKGFLELLLECYYLFAGVF